MRKVTSTPLPPPKALERRYKATDSTANLYGYTVVEMDEECNIVCVRKFDPALDNIAPVTLTPVKPIRRNHWTA